MKKTLLLLASVAMLLVGCAKEKLGPDAGSGEMVTANFTAQMQGMPQTKSVTDGEGTKANRCVMEIYYKGVLYTRDVQPISSMTATFTPRLVSNRTYDVLFWADCGEDLADKYYTTNAEGLGLQAVEMKATAYAANDDARDAFYTTESVPVGQQVSSKTFTLTRPFAQVNIITTDAAIIKNGNLYPDGVKMVYTAPTKFNLLSGELSEAKVLTVTGAPYEAFDATSPALTLEMDYLFTSEDKSALDIAFEASKTGESTVTSHSFTNIPVQRNYRTNIKGALLTTTGDWIAEIDHDWGVPDEEVKFVEAGSVAAANEAFANGATSVKITSVGEETTLYLPVLTDEVTIDFANPSDVITVKYGPAPTKAAGDKPAAVNIATNDVTKFVVSGISNVVWLAGNQAALASALNNAVAGQTVALANDIKMSGEWTPVTLKDGANFDGKNHVISNMAITDCGLDYAALISFMSASSEVKNVTVKNANIVYNSGKNARGAAIVGIAYGGTIENCHADSLSIKGYQKMGGIVGYLAQSGKQIIVRNCSAKNISFTNNTVDLTYQAGGIIGYILNYDGDILVEGCSVSDITINNQYDGSEGANLPYYCGTFIGSLDNQAAKEGLKIELKNNTISGTNTPQIDQMYANTYFGWANNNECTRKSQSYFATILIDGQEWTPNYPVKIVGGKAYATLAEALSAATAGQTVQILKAGDYTVQTLSTKAAVVEATVEGVVFNHTAGYKSWVSAQDGHIKTVKNITWNVGEANYQYFNNTNLENCTVNGQLCTHGTNKFKDCTFINEEGYNFWVYGNVYTEFDHCTFTCPGKNDGAAGCGSALNCYNESAQTPTPVLVVKNCTFTAKEASNKYSAIYVKPETAFDIRISNTTCNDKFCTGAISGSKLWNLKSDREGTTVSIDGNMVYPFSMDADGNYSVKNVNGLKMAIKHWNALTSKGEKTITMADGTYEVSDIPIIQAKEKSLVVKAANAKKAVLTPDAGTKTNMIFLISGGGLSTTGNEWVTFEGLKFNMPNDPGKITSAVFCTAQNDATYSPLVGESMTRYAHNITVRNCELQGCGSENSSLLKAAQGAGANIAVVDNCVVNHSGYVVSDYFSNVNIVDTKVTDTKACANIANEGITVEGCNISTYHDYCIRTNGGAVVVKGNTFNMTYDGTSTTAGIVVLRGTGNQASISGNTITKAVNTMWDCYCAKAWTVNGKAKAAGTGINF